MTTPETFAKNAEVIKKLADELAKIFPSCTRAEVEMSAAAGILKARELRDRAAKKAASKKRKKK